MQGVITVENISKEFALHTHSKWYNFIKPKRQTKVAVDNISFSLQRGDFVGFLGPNGAGKSTTIKMLTGILTPTNGIIKVNGVVPYENRTGHVYNIGVVFGQRTQLWWDLPPRDSFDLLAKMYQISPKKYQHNLAIYTKMLDLHSFMHVPVRKLSLGQKMRCELAAALLHDPDILFLDEPTIGLDLLAKEAIRDFLKQKNQQDGTTILLTTHDLDDVETLCQSVIIIDGGKIVKEESLSNLKAALGDEKIIAFEIDPHEQLSIPQGCRVVKAEGNIYHLAYSQQSTADIVKEMLEKHTVHDIAFVPVDISEIIKQAYLQKG